MPNPNAAYNSFSNPIKIKQESRFLDSLEYQGASTKHKYRLSG